MSAREQWFVNNAVTELWSGDAEQAAVLAMVPQGSVFRQVGVQQNGRIFVHYFGNQQSPAGDVWVDGEDLMEIAEPSPTQEPDWSPSEPEPAPVAVLQTYRPPTAPRIPRDHLPPILAAARVTELEPGLLAALAARESGFQADAYCRRPELGFVLWRESAVAPLARYQDGAVGPCQILRSTFLRFGVDDEVSAHDLATSYRTAALILRDNFRMFPGDRGKAVAAYRVDQYLVRRGRAPSDDFVETVLGWAEEYRPIFDRTSPSATPMTAELGQQLIAYGNTLQGTPYVFGGKYVERDHGLDCSGFVCEVLEHCGIRLGNRNYLSAEAIRHSVVPIDETEPQVGDLIFFEKTYQTPGASHVGFWAGSARMLDTHRPAGVQLTNFYEPYWQEHWLGLGRIL